MPSNTLKRILNFANIAAGATSSQAHGLEVNDVGVIPDLLERDNGNFAIVSVDNINVEVRNDGSGPETLNLLCEVWHSIGRSFGAAQTTELAPRPFIPAAGVGGSAVAGPMSIWAGGRESYDQDAPQLSAGAFEFNKSRYSFSEIRFRAVGARGDAVNAEVELFNVTDAATVATLTFTSTSQALMQTADIAASLPASSKIYEVRINLAAAPGASDSVELYKAELEVIP